MDFASAGSNYLKQIRSMEKEAYQALRDFDVNLVFILRGLIKSGYENPFLLKTIDKHGVPMKKLEKQLALLFLQRQQERIAIIKTASVN